MDELQRRGVMELLKTRGGSSRALEVGWGVVVEAEKAQMRSDASETRRASSSHRRSSSAAMKLSGKVAATSVPSFASTVRRSVKFNAPDNKKEGGASAASTNPTRGHHRRRHTVTFDAREEKSSVRRGSTFARLTPSGSGPWAGARVAESETKRRHRRAGSVPSRPLGWNEQQQQSLSINLFGSGAKDKSTSVHENIFDTAAEHHRRSTHRRSGSVPNVRSFVGSPPAVFLDRKTSGNVTSAAGAVMPKRASSRRGFSTKSRQSSAKGGNGDLLRSRTSELEVEGGDSFDVNSSSFDGAASRHSKRRSRSMLARGSRRFSRRRRRTGSFLSRAERFTESQDVQRILDEALEISNKGGKADARPELSKQIHATVNTAEQFLESIPPVSYEVIKRFRFGRRHKRILRLTSEGIENIRPKNGVVSKIHLYKHIVMASVTGYGILTVKYIGDHHHDNIYESPIASSIANEIAARLAMRRAVDKTRLTFDMALKVQEEVQRKLEGDTEIAARIGASDHMVYGASPRGRAPSRRATKLEELTGETETQRLRDAVSKYLYDSRTPEGRTRDHFLSTFNDLERNPDSAGIMVRQFIDGMSEHILETRIHELSLLQVDVATSSDSAPSINNRSADSLREIVFNEVERSVVAPLTKRLAACSAKKVGKETRCALREQLDILYHYPQKHFLPQELISPTKWASAVVEMKTLSTVPARWPLPTDAIFTLLGVAKAIYTSYNFERNRTLPPSKRKHHILGADDFLPILIFVIVRSRLACALELLRYMNELGNPDVTCSEGGYYLTVFEAAVEYLKSGQAVKKRGEEAKGD